MTKNQDAEHMGGPSFTPDIETNKEPGTPSRKTDQKSEAIREKHGKDIGDYGSTGKTKRPN